MDNGRVSAGGTTTKWVDIAVGVAVAIAAGLGAAASSRLTLWGIVLVAVAGSIFGWAAMHYVTPPVDRTMATIGVVVALVLGVGGAYHFQAPPNQASAQPEIRRFIDPEKIAVENPVDANKPFVVSDIKPTQVANRSPSAGLQPSEIVNRGKPVVVSLSGQGISSYSMVSFDMTEPNGTTFFGQSTYARGEWDVRVSLPLVPGRQLGSRRQQRRLADRDH
jgi:hypothetical protein